MTLFGNAGVVPVVMFHSVGADKLDWAFNYISSPYAPFESKIRELKQAGFNFIFWRDLYDYMAGRRQLTLPAIMLTFDDGYLDNWVHVFPVLKKYDVKATIFMTTDFIDPSSVPRPKADDPGRDAGEAGGLDIAGFLNFAEMRHMEASGLVDIQSHAKTHTWYFTGPKVADFWRPGLRVYPWMAWNAEPDRKPFYMREDQSGLVPFGTPVYENGKSLEVTRYIPAPGIAEELARYVADNDGARFFDGDGWSGRLREVHGSLVEKYVKDCRYETPAERRERIRIELAESKRVLEEGLSKKIDFICWPGGGYEPETLDIAREAGYKSWTLGSADQSSVRNVPGADPEHVKRIGSQTRQQWRGRVIGHTNGSEFLCVVRRHQGSQYHKWLGRGLRALRVARYYLGRGEA